MLSGMDDNTLFFHSSNFLILLNFTYFDETILTKIYAAENEGEERRSCLFYANCSHDVSSALEFFSRQCLILIS